MSELFKPNDPVEAKVRDAFASTLELLETDEDAFFEGAYTAFPLGDVLWETGHPLAGVLTQNVLRTSFPQIHELFSRPGTFEFYLSVFRAIWGETVDIEFDVSTPGKLLINIDALDAQADTSLARDIVSDVYVYEEILTDDGDNLVFQGSSGIKTQRETDALIRELFPAGLWVEATLTLS